MALNSLFVLMCHLRNYTLIHAVCMYLPMSVTSRCDGRIVAKRL